MVTFSGVVKYKDHESHTTKRGKQIQHFCTIRTQDTDSRRIYWFYDWSGKSHNGTLMRNHRHELLYLSGYLNSHGKTNFAVLQRWGIWDATRSVVLHPVTRDIGYIEVMGFKEEEHE